MPSPRGPISAGVGVVEKLHKEVLVTGGAGFIGSHVVDELLARRFRVLILDDLSSGQRQVIPSGAEFVHGQVQMLTDLDLPSRFDAIVHLAACASVNRSWQQIQELNDINIGGTLEVIKWACAHRVRRIVFASSAAVYGVPKALPIGENASLQPISPYGLQKASSEGYLRIFAEKGLFSALSLRFFNVYGERQSNASEYAGVISKFAHSISRGIPVEVFGDGLQTRDFVHVSDAAGSVVGAIERQLEPGAHLALNVGTGCPTTLLDLIESIESLTSNQVERKFGDPRIGDIHHSLADVTLAKCQIGFQPTTKLKAGLKRYLAWLDQERSRKHDEVRRRTSSS